MPGPISALALFLSVASGGNVAICQHENTNASRAAYAAYRDFNLLQWNLAETPIDREGLPGAPISLYKFCNCQAGAASTFAETPICRGD